MGTPYDYDSVMHYSDDGFSKNGNTTIDTNDPANQDRIGQRIYVNSYDWEKLNNVYCGGPPPLYDEAYCTREVTDQTTK